MKVKINQNLCKGCSLCVESCPMKILSLGQDVNANGYTAVVCTNLEKCTACAVCANMCPDSALEVE